MPDDIPPPIPLRAAALEAAAFAPFGEVIEHRGAERRHVIEAAIAGGAANISPALWVSRVEDEIAMPVLVDELEKHPHSDQAFVPLRGQPYLVVVCGSKPDGSADVATARAFVAGPQQGVLYRRDVWHRGLSVFAAPAEFVVVIGKSGEGDDDVFRAVSPPFVVLPPEDR